MGDAQMFRKLAASIVAITLASGTLMAQTAGPASPRVRLVTRAGKQISGRLAAVDADTVTLLPDGKNDPARIPLSSISVAEVSDGKGSRLVADLAGIGAGYGVIIALGVALGCADIYNRNSCGNSVGWIPFALGIASGVGIAHAIGRERWRAVPIISLAGLAPSP